MLTLSKLPRARGFDSSLGFFSSKEDQYTRRMASALVPAAGLATTTKDLWVQEYWDVKLGEQAGRPAIDMCWDTSCAAALYGDGARGQALHSRCHRA